MLLMICDATEMKNPLRCYRYDTTATAARPRRRETVNDAVR